jgi:hypothetical protein
MIRMNRTLSRPRPSFGLRCSFISLGILLPLAGCHDYNWKTDYQKAETQAREQNKYLFVFYKSWLSSDSNRMHGDVLADPAVGDLFQDTINVLLEKDSCPEFARYMTKYDVTAPPAFVIAAPDGTYQARTGFIPKDRFMEFVQSAKTPHPDRPGQRKARPNLP